MKVYFLLALCFPLFSYSTETQELASKEAFYDGDTLILKGDVSLSHLLGNMQAEEALLQRQETAKETPFSSIELKRSVVLIPNNNSRVTCESAFLNFNSLHAKLFGNCEKQVIYTDLLTQKKTEKQVPLRLSTEELEMAFSPADTKQNTEHPQLESLQGKGSIRLSYDQDLDLFCDEVDCRRLPGSQELSTLTARPFANEGVCKIRCIDQDLFSDHIDIDLSRSHLTLLNPHGHLPSQLMHHSQPLELQAETLEWDQLNNIIWLKGNSSLQDRIFGSCQTQEEMRILFDSKDKLLLKHVYTQGASKLIHTDTQGTLHHLSTKGPIHIDKDGYRAYTSSSPDQVRYETALFTVLADNALIEYAQEKETVRPSHITLKGHVRFLSKDPAGSRRLGYADALSYDIPSQVGILSSATKEKKVLFQNEAEGMRMSAPEVHIQYDEASQSPQVQGVGAVQFGFNTEEEKKIQKLLGDLEKN